MTMKVTEQQVELNLEFLTGTDQQEAELEVQTLRLQKEEKHLISKLKVERFSNYKSDTERSTQAYATDDYKKYIDDLVNTTREYKKL